jgi:hypothetical protein
LKKLVNESKHWIEFQVYLVEYLSIDMGGAWNQKQWFSNIGCVTPTCCPTNKSVCHPKFATTNPSVTSIFSRPQIEFLRVWKQGTYC